MMPPDKVELAEKVLSNKLIRCDLDYLVVLSQLLLLSGSISGPTFFMLLLESSNNTFSEISDLVHLTFNILNLYKSNFTTHFCTFSSQTLYNSRLLEL